MSTRQGGAGFVVGVSDMAVSYPKAAPEAMCDDGVVSVTPTVLQPAAPAAKAALRPCPLNADRVDQVAEDTLQLQGLLHPPPFGMSWMRAAWKSQQGLLYLELDEPPLSFAVLEMQLRSTAAYRFQPEGWSDMSFGVVIRSNGKPLVDDDPRACIDLVARAAGSLHWLIFVSRDPAWAVATHTWQPVPLSPLYDSMLQALADDGIQVTERKIDRSSVPFAQRAMGTLRGLFSGAPLRVE